MRPHRRRLEADAIATAPRQAAFQQEALDDACARCPAGPYRSGGILGDRRRAAPVIRALAAAAIRGFRWTRRDSATRGARLREQNANTHRARVDPLCAPAVDPLCATRCYPLDFLCPL